MAVTNKASAIPTHKRGQEFSVDPALLLMEVPPPPPDLNPVGIKWWGYYGGLMVEGKMFSRMFLTALHNLCIQHMLRDHVQNALNADGRIYIHNVKTIKEDVVETLVINPLVQELQRIMVNMTRFLETLGMTVPTSKAQQLNTTGTGPNLAQKPPSPFEGPLPENGEFDLGFDMIPVEPPTE